MASSQVIAAIIVAIVLTAMIVAAASIILTGAKDLSRSHKAASSAKRTDKLTAAYQPESPPDHLDEQQAKHYRTLARRRRRVVGSLAHVQDRIDRDVDSKHSIPFLARLLTRRQKTLYAYQKQRLERELSELARH